MSLTLGTVSSPVVNGRCMGCGRFIPRDESHFHSKRKFRGPPRVHLFRFGEGGIVTRCDDAEQGHMLILKEYAWEEYGKRFDQLDDDDRHDVLARFPFQQGRVERGRISVVNDPDYAWRWAPEPDDAKGPGITTAVVWS